MSAEAASVLTLACAASTSLIAPPAHTPRVRPSRSTWGLRLGSSPAPRGKVDVQRIRKPSPLVRQAAQRVTKLLRRQPPDLRPRKT